MAQGTGEGACRRSAGSPEGLRQGAGGGEEEEDGKRRQTVSKKARPGKQRRLYVLDTNVLMHDPTAIFRFQEHDIFLPMVVLEELDAGKKGVSEAARNVRQVSRFLDDMMRDV